MSVFAFALPPSFYLVLRAINDVLRRILMLPPQASTVATEIDALQYFEFAMYALISVVYIGAAVYFVLRFRRGRKHDYVPQHRAPGLVMVYAAHVFAVFALFGFLGHLEYAHLRAAPSNARDVYVTAKQWMWKFAYADGGATVGVLYVPVGQPIRLLITSRDVIHSFWVPAFRLKQDAVPGTFNTLWFEVKKPGAYQVMCAQMCGPGHSRMWAQVVALGPEDYERWREGEQPEVSRAAVGLTEAGPNQPAASAPGTADPIVHGKDAAAQYGCLRCHTVDGQRHIGPTWLGLFGSDEPLQDGTSAHVDAAYITESMMDPAAKIVRGFPNVMPSYQGLIQPDDTASIIEYIKSLRNARAPHTMAPLPTGPLTGPNGVSGKQTAPPHGGRGGSQ